MSRLRLSSRVASTARCDTPRSASGMSATMTSALKMIADRIADAGECSCMMFSAARPGTRPRT